MSWDEHERNYIDYLGRRDGEFFGGEFGRALVDNPILFEKNDPLNGTGLFRCDRPNIRRSRVSIMAKKTKKNGNGKGAKMKKMTGADKRRLKKEQRRTAKREKKIAKLEKKRDILQAKIDKLKDDE